MKLRASNTGVNAGDVKNLLTLALMRHLTDKDWRSPDWQIIGEHGNGFTIIVYMKDPADPQKTSSGKFRISITKAD